MNSKTFIIAEMGVNHNGDLQIAKRLIDEAVAAGADAVKSQIFVPEKGISKNAEKAEYQKTALANDHDSQLAMVKKLELTIDMYKELMAYAEYKDILFFSTPFDLDSIDRLEEFHNHIYKIPSGEITHLPYLIKIGKLKKKVIMSTGMSDLEEVGTAIKVLQENGTTDITVLHCNTQYPTPFEDANIRAMLTLKETFGLPVGYSDHTPGIEAAVAAVALGATVIEKHFTLDRNMEGPDHKASLEPDEFKSLVSSIRNVEAAMGDGIKKASPSETANMAIARKSIVAARDIQKGEIFTEDNLAVKRPGTGISPMKWFEVLGQAAKRNFEYDELIEL